MFVDTSICTGCKACQVACKEWNGLDPEPAHFTQAPGAPYPVATNFTGTSYDNTGRLGARNWRHVLFLEQINTRRAGSRWLFMSDSCKHCNDAACLNVCPAEAIERTDLGNVVVRQDKCVGNKLCNKACPFGVVTYSEKTRTSHKCTLCNDRIHNGLGTACAKACPTGSILFGDVPELKAKADARLARLRALGETKANLYGYTEAGGLNVFYLLRDDPAVYGLPEKPVVQQKKQFGALPRRTPGLAARFAALATGLAAVIGFRERVSRGDRVRSGKE
jgi:formate dehydrogenase iron-sulfur subunit